MVAAPTVERPGWFASRWERLNGPTRITGIDLARGFAVVGMLAAHLLWIREDFSWTDPSTWIDVVDGRSSILFATLAGVSIGLATGGTTPLQGERLAFARVSLALRACMLWALGVLLILTGVPVYVILPAYAILFLLVLPMLRLRAQTLFALAAGLGLVMPFVQGWLDSFSFWRTPPGTDLSIVLGWHYPFPVWIAFVVAGLGLARAGVQRLKVQFSALGAGVALAVLGYGLDAAFGAASVAIPPGEVWTATPHSSGLFEVIGSGGFAIAVIGLCLLICRTVLVWVVLPIRAVGAMPLTAYTAQLVAWAIIATVVLGNPGDLAGFRDLEPFWPMTLWLVAACTAWALVIGRGPFEWVLDRVTRLSSSRRRGTPRRVDRLES